MSSDTITGLVSPSDIAQMAGVSRGAVSNWRKRHDDFPGPVGGSSTKPLFNAHDVVAWLRQQGRAVAVPSADEQIWSALNGLRDAMPMLDAAKLALFLATVRRASESVASNLRYDDILTAAPHDQPRVLGHYAEELSKLPGLEHVQPPVTPRESVACLASMIDSVADKDLVTAVEQGLQSAERWQARGGGEFGFVESRTSQLLASLVSKGTGTIYDPACGIASALLSLAGRNPIARLVGHDVDEDALNVACQRAFLHGTDLELDRADILAEDPVPDLVADAIVAEPPMGLRWNSSQALSDPRFTYGIPGRASSDLAWVQHVIAHLSADGRGYVLTSHAPLFRGGADGKIRGKLLAAGCVEAIVTLPPKMLPHISIPLALWVLRPAQEPTSVRLIDASDEPSPETRIAVLINSDHSEHDASSQRSITVADLLADDANLVPSRWLHVASVDNEEVPQRFRDAARSLSRRITAITRDIPTAVAVPELPASQVATIKRLIDDGIVELVRGRREKEQPTDQYSQARIVRASDVRDCTLASQEIATQPQEGAETDAADGENCSPGELRYAEDPRMTQPGDVLVTTMNEVRAIVDADGGHLPSTGVDRLRITNGSILLAEYLAATLTGSWNARLQTGSTIKRAPIRELEVPLVPVDAQGDIARAYLKLRQVRRDAASLRSDADQIQSAILDALRYNVSLPNLDNNAVESEVQESH